MTYQEEMINKARGAAMKLWVLLRDDKQAADLLYGKTKPTWGKSPTSTRPAAQISD